MTGGQNPTLSLQHRSGVRDGRLVTGQNPFSSAPVTDLVLDALKEG
jgi:putative intracellular protease/amidase